MQDMPARLQADWRISTCGSLWDTLLSTPTCCGGTRGYLCSFSNALLHLPEFSEARSIQRRQLSVTSDYMSVTQPKDAEETSLMYL